MKQAIACKTKHVAPAGSMENQVATLETRAVAKMSQMTLSNSFHDYANVVRRVERATVAVNKAFHALHLAHLDFDREEDQQNLY